MLGGEFSLTELRVLYELSARDTAQASTLCRELGLDAGYLSRVVARLQRMGLVDKQRSQSDARSSTLTLSAKGKASFRPYEEASRNEVIAMLQPLSEGQQLSLLDAMDRIDQLLGEPSRDYLLREPRAGDMGWVVHKQAQLYANEYGWNSEFEALLAEIVSSYLRGYDRASDKCWIA